MGLHVYCIVPAGHAIPDSCSGLDGVRPTSIQAGELALWVTRHDAPVSPALDAVRTHNSVVNAAMTPSVTPVPVRFGQWFATETDAAERVTADAPKWIALLERFAGRAEYGVRVQSAGPETERDVHTGGAESGTEYMAALARKQARIDGRRREAERIAALIEAGAGSYAADRRIGQAAEGEPLLTVAHLVAWSDATAYHSAIAGASDDLGEARVVLTGPWPPYSFVA